MSVARKTGKKTTNKKRRPTPGETTVKDRIVGLTLGHEASVLASFFRAYGADPKQLPDVLTAGKDWKAVRGWHVKMPIWAIDWAVAVLEQIPERSSRKAGRTKQDAVKRVELFAQVMGTAGAARWVATLEASQRGEGAAQDKIEKRRLNLQDRAYRRPKTDMS